MSVWTIIVVILMLGLLVTIHELGHYWTATLLKIKAFEVSIFVGPKLIKWKNKKGVDFSIRCIPFGAYVLFTQLDDNGNPVESDDPGLLVNQPRFKRLLVSLAGPFMNIILGVLIFAALNCATGFTSLDIAKAPEGTQLYSQAYDPGDTITHVNGNRVFTQLDYYYESELAVSSLDKLTLTLKSKADGSEYNVILTPEIGERPMIGVTADVSCNNKYKAWEIISVDENQNGGNPVLKAGDYLVSVDGKATCDEDFNAFLATRNEGDTMKLEYVRNGETFTADCIKTMIKYSNPRGIYLVAYPVISVDTFFRSAGYAAKMPITVANVSVKSIRDVFVGKEKVYNMVSGPVGVTTAVSDVVDDVDDSIEEKVYSVFMLCGYISIGLAFTNLMPIPGLDGVQIVLIIAEMVIGRHLSKKTENFINAIGFVLLIALVIFALASDVIRIFIGG
ncbi:MAG: RIP metalloprotease RseP [Clostridiales bacterium]|nr:RIP metalloprotease RseP [Clostridiales bacterium]